MNRFGYHGGFDRLAERFSSEKLSTLNVPLIHALVRPFGQCYDVLTPKTIRTYLLPIVENVPVFLANLKDDELKKEAKNESKNDSVSAIIKSLKSLASVAAAHPGKRISFILFSKWKSSLFQKLQYHFAIYTVKHLSLHSFLWPYLGSHDQ